MPQTNAERQKRHRAKHAESLRYVTAMLLELKEEIDSLRNEMASLRNAVRNEIPANIRELQDVLDTLRNGDRNEQPLNGFLRNTPLKNPPKESPSLIPNLIRSLDDEYEEIHALYPRHVGKGQARRAYRTARKQASFDTILAGVKRFATEHQVTEKKYIPHPATWLNGQRWLDEDDKPNGHASSFSGPRPPTTPAPTLRELGLE